jgi:LL-diaminopimelate aminotransferase
LQNGQWSNIYYIPCVPENNFEPQLPTKKVDVVYLCYPNNPTGTTLTKTQLKKWVDYALQNEVLILFDGAYEAFITEDDVPHSIYEIEGAKQVAIEFRSFSKTAGFTGTRCGIYRGAKRTKSKNKMERTCFINKLWNRRQQPNLMAPPTSYKEQQRLFILSLEKTSKRIH